MAECYNANGNPDPTQYVNASGVCVQAGGRRRRSTRSTRSRRQNVASRRNSRQNVAARRQNASRRQNVAMRRNSRQNATRRRRNNGTGMRRNY